MTTNFPGAIDVLTNPAGSVALGGSAPRKHSEQHADANDAIEAIEARIGVVGSADPASLENRLTTHNHDASGLTGFAPAALAAAPPETASTIGSLVAGATGKATPVDDDSLGLSDSANGNTLKKWTWANIKSALNGIFARLSGVSGGQTLIGGTQASDKLSLQATSASGTTDSDVAINILTGNNGERNAVTVTHGGSIGLGNGAPTAKLDVMSTTEQLRLGYDAVNNLSILISSSGIATFTGSAASYKLVGPTAVQSSATLGSELVTNGLFNTDLSGWTAGSGWSWSSGAALHTAGNTATIAQNVNVSSGYTYQLDLTITGRTAGSISVVLGAVSVIESGIATAHTSTLSRTVIAGATGSVSLSITPTSDFNGAIDNVTLKLVTLGSFPSVITLTEDGSAAIEIRQSLARSNVSVGISSGRSVTTGINNSNFGPDAGRSITTGSSNSNFGVSAGRSITIGNGNSNLGISSGYSITTGANNTNFGRDAGRSITTGSSNSNFGVTAGRSITIGNANSLFGTSSGYNISTGSGNCTFGASAGRYIADGTTALSFPTNCVYVGASTKASADSVTAENAFGYNAIGIGSNTTCIGASTNTKTQMYGDIVLDKTVTASGTTGAQTINKTCGSVNFAAGATSLTVTNSRITTSSIIIATVATSDTTMKTVIVVAAAGSFTITANAAATAETRVNWLVIN